MQTTSPPASRSACSPSTVDGWTSKDIPIGDDVLAILGKGDFLNRLYVPPVAEQQAAAAAHQQLSPVSLFIGYFASQRTGQSIHSPQNCLPGAGWVFQSSRYVDLTAANNRLFHVGEYIISNGGDRQFVLYWYQSHGRSIANEYKAKFYMIADAIRMNRTDGAIVRVITPMLPAESEDSRPPARFPFHPANGSHAAPLHSRLGMIASQIVLTSATPARRFRCQQKVQARRIWLRK